MLQQFAPMGNQGRQLHEISSLNGLPMTFRLPRKQTSSKPLGMSQKCH